MSDPSDSACEAGPIVIDFAEMVAPDDGGLGISNDASLVFPANVGTATTLIANEALTGVDFKWNEKTLFQLFDKGPNKVLPGTKMPMQMVPDAEKDDSFGGDTCNSGTCSDHTGDPCPGPDGDDNCSES